MDNLCIECGKKKGFMSVNYAGFNIKSNKYVYPFPERIKDLILPGDKSKDFLCADCASKRTIECSVHGMITDGKFAVGVAPACKQCKEEKLNEVKQSEGTLTAKEIPNIEIPQDQENFIKLIESFYEGYKQAPNDLKKSALRAERKISIENFLQSLNVKGWVGKLRTMGTNSDGKAYIEIELEGSKIEVRTWNNALSDISDQTLINNGSDLYNNISELSKGTRIRFSGSFKKREKDYITEVSLTEYGAMINPKFIMSFTDVSLY